MAKTRYVGLVVALLFVLWAVLAYQSSSVQATSPQGAEAAVVLPETGATSGAPVSGSPETGAGVLEGLAVLFVSMLGVILVGFTVGFKTRPW